MTERKYERVHFFIERSKHCVILILYYIRSPWRIG